MRIVGLGLLGIFIGICLSCFIGTCRDYLSHHNEDSTVLASERITKEDWHINRIITDNRDIYIYILTDPSTGQEYIVTKYGEGVGITKREGIQK